MAFIKKGIKPYQNEKTYFILKRNEPLVQGKKSGPLSLCLFINKWHAPKKWTTRFMLSFIRVIIK